MAEKKKVLTEDEIAESTGEPALKTKDDATDEVMDEDGERKSDDEKPDVIEPVKKPPAATLAWKRTTTDDFVKYTTIHASGVALVVPDERGIVNGAGGTTKMTSLVDPKSDEPQEVTTIPDMAIAASMFVPPRPEGGIFKKVPSVIADDGTMESFRRGLGAPTTQKISAIPRPLSFTPDGIANGFNGRPQKFGAIIAPNTQAAIHAAAVLYDQTYETARLAHDYEERVFGDTDYKRTPIRENETVGGVLRKYVVGRRTFPSFDREGRSLIMSPVLLRTIPELEAATNAFAKIQLTPGVGANSDGTRTDLRTLDLATTFSNGSAGAMGYADVLTSIMTQPFGRFIPKVTGSTNAAEGIFALASLTLIPPVLHVDGGMRLVKQVVSSMMGAVIQKRQLRRIVMRFTENPRRDFIALFPVVQRRIAANLWTLLQVLFEQGRWVAVDPPYRYFWGAGLVVPAPLAPLFNRPMSGRVISAFTAEVVEFREWLLRPWRLISTLTNDAHQRQNWRGLTAAPSLALGLTHAWSQVAINMPVGLMMSPAFQPDVEIEYNPADMLSVMLWGFAEGQATPDKPKQARQIVLAKAPTLEERDAKIGAVPVLADLIIATTVYPLRTQNVASYLIARTDRWAEIVEAIVLKIVDGSRDLVRRIIDATIDLILSHFATLESTRALNEWVAGQPQPNAEITAFFSLHVGNTLFPLREYTQDPAIMRMFEMPATKPFPRGAYRWLDEFVMVGCPVVTSRVESIIYQSAIPLGESRVACFDRNQYIDMLTLRPPRRPFLVDADEVRKMGATNMFHLSVRQTAVGRPQAARPIRVPVSAIVKYKLVEPNTDQQFAESNFSAVRHIGPFTTSSKIYLNDSFVTLPIQLVEALVNPNRSIWSMFAGERDFFIPIVSADGRGEPGDESLRTITVAEPDPAQPRRPRQRIQWNYDQQQFDTDEFLAKYVAVEIVPIEYRVQGDSTTSA